MRYLPSRLQYSLEDCTFTAGVPQASDVCEVGKEQLFILLGNDTSQNALKYQHNITVATPNRGVCFLHSDRVAKHEPVLNWVLPTLFPQDLLILSSYKHWSSCNHVVKCELSQTKVTPAVKQGQVLAQMGSLRWLSSW